MKKRIYTNDSQDAVDKFLQDEYTYSIWEFLWLLLEIHRLYSYNDEFELQMKCEERIEQLKEFRDKVIDMLDDFISKIHLWPAFTIDQNNSEHAISSKDLKEKILIEKFRLFDFFDQLDKAINNYAVIEGVKEIDASFSGIEDILNVKPINLLMLVLAQKITRGKRKNWVNIEGLLAWAAKNIKIPVIRSFYDFDQKDYFNSEYFRQVRYKYRDGEYMRLAREISIISDAALSKGIDLEERVRGWIEFFERYEKALPVSLEFKALFQDTEALIPVFFPDQVEFKYSISPVK